MNARDHGRDRKGENSELLMKKPGYSELAKNLCAAFFAHRLGISITHARKRYVDQVADGDIHESWYELAERFDWALADGILGEHDGSCARPSSRHRRIARGASGPPRS
jgi:hypothetical protein